MSGTRQVMQTYLLRTGVCGWSLNSFLQNMLNDMVIRTFLDYRPAFAGLTAIVPLHYSRLFLKSIIQSMLAGSPMLLKLFHHEAFLSHEISHLDTTRTLGHRFFLITLH